MRVWLEMRTQEDANRMAVFALVGSLNGGTRMPAMISPLNPTSVNVDFGDCPVEFERIRAYSMVVGAGEYHDNDEFPNIDDELWRRLDQSFPVEPSLDMP